MVSLPSGRDWRKFDTYYPSVASLSDRGWAWEFLRRHSGYQAAALRFAAPQTSVQDTQRIVKPSSDDINATRWGLVSFRGSSLRCKRRSGLLAIVCLLVDSPRHFFSGPSSRFG